MVGLIGSPFARSHGGDRFYNPPPIRRQQELQRQQQQELQRQQQQELQRRQEQQQQEEELQRRQQQQQELKQNEVNEETLDEIENPSPAPPMPSLDGNLDRFIESTIPFVPAQYFSKTDLRSLRNAGAADLQCYYNLSDLWESYKEWSAYGAGVPLVLKGNEEVVQYYVPYLSGLQLYVDSSKLPSSMPRRAGEESDGDSGESASDDACEQVQAQSVLGSLGRLSLRDQPLQTGGYSSDDAEASNPQGHLIFEYMERDLPYIREPLANKISNLSRQFSGLKTYKSSDLLPSSWISVAWYPIYRIPMGPTLRDLDSCFLTYHSLATPSKNISDGHPGLLGKSRGRKVNDDPSHILCLRIFGLASYKFRESIWTNGIQQASSLSKAAEDFLHQLKVRHPDFDFFITHSS